MFVEWVIRLVYPIYSREFSNEFFKPIFPDYVSIGNYTGIPDLPIEMDTKELEKQQRDDYFSKVWILGEELSFNAKKLPIQVDPVIIGYDKIIDRFVIPKGCHWDEDSKIILSAIE